MSTPTSQPSSQSTPVAATTPVPAAQPVAKPVTTDVKPTEKAVVAEIPKKYKVKVDNQEREVEERELIENYQMRQLSDKKRSEAEKVMTEYKKLFDTLKQDPIKFLHATGIDFDKLSTSYLAKKAEESMLDPKERELQKAQAEAAQYKKWVEEQKTKQADAEKAQKIDIHRKQIHQEIISAIEAQKELGMPVDEELVIAIAQKMKLQDRKQKPLDAKEGLSKAYESTQKFLHGVASKMEGEALVKWLGPDVAKKIRQYDLAQLKAKRGAATQPQQVNSLVKPKETTEAPKKHYKTWSEFKKETLDKIQ